MGFLLRSLSKQPDCNSLCYYTRSLNYLTKKCHFYVVVWAMGIDAKASMIILIKCIFCFYLFIKFRSIQTSSYFLSSLCGNKALYILSIGYYIIAIGYSKLTTISINFVAAAHSLQQVRRLLLV